MRGPAEVYLWLGTQLAHGNVGPTVYDDEAVTAEMQRLTDGRVRDIVSPSPPTLALFTAPLAVLKSSTVQPTWAALGVLAILAAVVLTYRAVGWPRESLPLAILLTAGLLLSAPLQEDLSRGQIYHLTLLWMAVSTWGYATGRDWLIGLGLALALTMKVAGVPIWLLLAFERRWRALAWASAWTLALVIVSLQWIPVATYSRWMFDVVPVWLVTPKMMVPAYQTVTGFMQHLLRFDPAWNPGPLANVPTVARLLVVAVSSGLLIATLRASRRDPDPSTTVFAAAIVLGIVIQPTIEQYGYVTGFVPFVVGTMEWARRPSFTVGLCLLAAAALLAIPFPYKHPLLGQGALALLAYPRLYGGLLLWGILMRQSMDGVVLLPQR